MLEHDEMVLVPAGAFWMGCNPDVDALADAFPEARDVPRTCEDELFPATPFRSVELSAFWIDRTEVTKGSYRQCLDVGVCTAPTEWDRELPDEQGNPGPGPEDIPVGSVTFSQAEVYCEWVGKRLPTEAEWEKAARGTDARKYPWGNSPEPDCTLANHLWLSPDGPVSCAAGPALLMNVGSLPGNTSPYGAVDMAGNVQEWTSDGYDGVSGYEGLPSIDPRQPDGEFRIRRGCSYQCSTVAADGYVLRVSQRFMGGANTQWEFLSQGFRCARDA